MKPTVIFLSLWIFASVFAATASAQSMYFSIGYKLEPMKFEGEYDAPPDLRAPQLGKLNVEYPEQARKNGVQGTVKVTATLGEDGKIRDIHIDQDLPSGVGTAVTNALQSCTFTPGSINGKPIAMVVHVEYTVTLAYPEMIRTSQNRR
jgi:TonB family protein